MSRQTWAEQVAWITSDGAAIANTAAETIIFPDITLFGNYMVDGRTLNMRAFGRYSTTGTPTLTFRLRYGGLSGAVIWSSGAIVSQAAAAAAQWGIDCLIQTRLNGPSGTLFAMGDAVVGANAAPTVGSATGAAAVSVGGSAGVQAPAAVTVDLTADAALCLTAQWSAASASNTLTGHLRSLLSMN